jgi:hypothetical protein
LGKNVDPLLPTISKIFLLFLPKKWGCWEKISDGEIFIVFCKEKPLFTIRNSQIRYFLAHTAISNLKNFSGVPVICKFLQNTAKLSLKPVLKVAFKFFYKFELQ